MKTYLCSEEQFLKDVSKHEMTVIRDDGVNRHLRFKRPNEGSYWFDIVTWNGILTVTGDMGTYVFSRIEDMFGFFRTSSNDFNFNKDGLSINPSYWGEKLLAISNSGKKASIEEFDENAFKQQVKEHFEEFYQEDIDEVDVVKEDPEAFTEREKQQIIKKTEARAEIWEDIEQALDCCYSEHDFFQTINEYRWDSDFESPYDEFYFQDFFDGQSYYHYTFHYVWICYALAWAVKMYDESKQKLADVNETISF